MVYQKLLGLQAHLTLHTLPDASLLAVTESTKNRRIREQRQYCKQVTAIVRSLQLSPGYNVSDSCF